MGQQGTEGGYTKKERKEGPRCRDVATWKKLSSFTRCSRRVFLCVDRLFYDEGHVVILLRSLRCLRR